MPVRPLIGITFHGGGAPRMYGLYHNYADAVEHAGGLPVVLPFHTDVSLVPQLVDRLDGVLFTGGDDLDPALYGEERHPKAVPLAPLRQRFELALVAEVDKRRMPAMGICLGNQLMNLHRGGSLHQFLPDLTRDGPLEHRKLDADSREHAVELRPESLLARRLGRTQIIANTSHKQAIKQLGRGLRVTATSPDGIIEGIEDPQSPLFFAVQWHPERLHDQPEHLAPFQILVEKAAQGR